MSIDNTKYRNLQRLWPLAVVVLAACGGAGDGADESAADSGDVATATADREDAEARRRRRWIPAASRRDLEETAARNLSVYGCGPVAQDGQR